MWYDQLFMHEVDVLIWVQDVFKPMEGVLEVFSKYSTMSWILYYLLPLLGALNGRMFVSVLLVTLASAYSINILKWILAEPRPTWWVHETSAYKESNRPVLFQSALTCETTPGSPSGHTMFNAAFLYVLIHEVFRGQREHVDRAPKFKHLETVCWILYPVYLTLVTVSRMYYSCHFLHQCLFGLALGYFGAKFMVRPNGLVEHILDKEKKRLGIAALLWISIAVCVYLLHFALKLDPLWSVHSAFKWCRDPHFVQPESTTVYLLIRDFGLLCGLLMATPFADKLDIRLKTMRTIPLATIIVIAHHFLILYTPRTRGVYCFYACTFLANALMVFSLVYLVPKVGEEEVFFGPEEEGHHGVVRRQSDAHWWGSSRRRRHQAHVHED